MIIFFIYSSWTCINLWYSKLQVTRNVTANWDYGVLYLYITPKLVVLYATAQEIYFILPKCLKIHTCGWWCISCKVSHSCLKLLFFVKSKINIFNICYPMCSPLTNVLNYTGSRVTHLGSDMRKKLKAAYTLIEQLYTGAQRVICTAAHNKQPPTLIKDTLEKLSMLHP